MEGAQHAVGGADLHNIRANKTLQLGSGAARGEKEREKDRGQGWKEWRTEGAEGGRGLRSSRGRERMGK